ncbi:MAG: hypothetical protein ACK59B_07030, partial [Alphaproteobacteria bacterium]
IQCERAGNGKCITPTLCYGDYRSGEEGCTSPAEHRAWSSPIYLDYRVKAAGPLVPGLAPAGAPNGG